MPLFFCLQEVQTILVNHTYGLNELKFDLQEFYKKAAVKPAQPQAKAGFRLADFACYLLYISHIILQIFYDIFRLGLELKISNEIHLLSDFLST